jgi:hypothetical protein
LTGNFACEYLKFHHAVPNFCLPDIFCDRVRPKLDDSPKAIFVENSYPRCQSCLLWLVELAICFLTWYLDHNQLVEC